MQSKTINSRTIVQKMVADKPDHVKPIPPKWTGEWQAGYSPDDGIKTNLTIPDRSIPDRHRLEKRLGIPTHHLNYVMAIAKAIVKSDDHQTICLIPMVRGEYQDFR